MEECSSVMQTCWCQIIAAQQTPADLDIDRDDPCPEDEEFFDRPDATTMKEAISLFLDGMEAQECSGFRIRRKWRSVSGTSCFRATPGG